MNSVEKLMHDMFRSGNDIPVTRATISRNDYEKAKDADKTRYQFINGKLYEQGLMGYVMIVDEIPEHITNITDALDYYYGDKKC